VTAGSWISRGLECDGSDRMRREVKAEADRPVFAAGAEQFLHETRRRPELARSASGSDIPARPFAPLSARVGVILVDTLDRGNERYAGVGQMDVSRLHLDLTAQLCVVRGEHHDRRAVTNDPGIDGLARAGDRQPLAAEPMSNWKTQ
jgi:hypothetical protein